MSGLSRRKLLAGSVAAAGAGLAGCIGAPTAASPEDSGDDADGYTAEAVQPEGDAPLSLDAEVIGGGLTDPDGPLALRLTVQNERDRIVAFGERRMALFHSSLSTSPDETYVIWPAARIDGQRGEAYDRIDGCWMRTTYLLMTGDFQVEKLDPGASTEADLAVLVAGDPGRDDDEPAPSCPDEHAETIEFETTVSTPPLAASADEAEQYEWGIALQRES